MISINGVVLNLKNPKTDEEKAFDKGWKYLNQKYKLSKNGHIVMKIREELKHKEISTNMNFRDSRTQLVYPRGTIVPFKTVYTLINIGERVECVYFETKVENERTSKIKYSPRNEIIRGDTVLTIRDKEKILYLYMVSEMVADSYSNYDIDRNSIAKFYFEDRVAEAKQKISKRQRAYNAYKHLDSLNADDLLRFASVMNVDETSEPEIIKEDLLSMIESDKIYYDKLIDFINNHDEIIYEVERRVKHARSSKVIGFKKTKDVRKQDMIMWGYRNGVQVDEEIMSYKGTGALEEVLVKYFITHKEAYNTLCIKLDELGKNL